MRAYPASEVHVCHYHAVSNPCQIYSVPNLPWSPRFTPCHIYNGPPSLSYGFPRPVYYGFLVPFWCLLFFITLDKVLEGPSAHILM